MAVSKTSSKKARYESYRVKHTAKLVQRKAQRDKQVAFFRENPKAGSPSQVRMRSRVAQRNKRKQIKKEMEQQHDGRGT